MSEIQRAHPDRPIALTDICLPSSHDAAMYLTQHCTAFANSGNTQTQYLDMQHQLESGLRLFDIRPMYYHGDYYTIHSTHCDGLGCKGDLMRNILRDTRTFLDAHAEIVMYQITHSCHTGAADTALLTLLTDALGDRIYRETAAQKELIHTSLREIVPADSRTGKVILLIEGMPNTAANRAKGFFNDGVLTSAGGWTNDNHYEELKPHQLNNLIAYPGNGMALFQLAWQVTQHDPQALRSAFDPHSPTAIYRGARAANADLPRFIDSLITSGVIHKGKIPNIIWDDLADTMVTQQSIRLTTLNLK